MFKIFLCIIGVILVVALLTNKSVEEKTMNIAPVPAMRQQVDSVSGSEAARLNPPHGQPGHRCEIAVGAPLPAGTAPTVKTSPFKMAPSTPKLNPAHGQPGHRCDIAVGQPLP